MLSSLDDLVSPEQLRPKSPGYFGSLAACLSWRLFSLEAAFIA